MEYLDKQRLILIALELDLPSILNLCSTNKRIDSLICKNGDFWKSKLIKDFNFIFYGISNNKRDPQRYYYILYDKNIEKRIKKAVKYGYFDLVKFISDKMTYIKIFNLGLKYSIRNGSDEMIEYFIEKGANNWNIGLREAARKKDLKLIEYFIKKGANDWNEGLYGAAESGDKNIINYFIDKGANKWDKAIIAAAKNNLEIVLFFKKKFSYILEKYIHWNLIAINSITGKDSLNIINYIIKHESNIIWGDVLIKASKKGKMEIVKIIISKDDKVYNNINNAIYSSIEGGHIDIIYFLCSKMFEKNKIVDWNSLMIKAIEENNFELGKYFVSNGAFEFDRGMKITKNNRIKDLLLQKKKEMKNKIKEIAESIY